MTTPLQLIATAGLYQNQGIAANTAMLTAISSYETSALFAPLLQCIINGGNANIAPVTIGGANTARFSSNTLGNLNTLGYTVCPALSDAIPSGVANVTANNASPGLTGAIKLGASTVIPTDLTKFMQAFSAATGYVVITNRVINTAKNSATFLGPTFTNMNALTTGEISSVNSNILAFGQDLQKLGKLIDLSRLGDLGSPAQLLRQLIVVGGLVPGVLGALNNSGVPAEEVNQIPDPGYQMSDTLQKAAYRAMTQIHGDDLIQVLEILDVTTQGITTMADLLNPYKLFPNSYLTFTAPTSQGLQPIYVNSAVPGTVNALLESTLPDYFIKVGV